jgi:hypothetical protein
MISMDAIRDDGGQKIQPYMWRSLQDVTFAIRPRLFASIRRKDRKHG